VGAKSHIGSLFGETRLYNLFEEAPN